MYVYEAHSVSLHGKGFRPEFVESMEIMQRLYESLPNKYPQIAVSTIFRDVNQQHIVKLWKAKPDYLVGTNMCCRRIFVDVVSSSNPTKASVTCIRQDLDNDSKQKSSGTQVQRRRLKN